MRVLLIVYDNGSKIHTFPQGTAYIARVLVDAGHEVEIYNQDVNHLPDECLTEFLDAHDRYDIIGIGVIGGYWQYQRLLGLSKAIHESNNQPRLLVLGGHGPSAAPGYFLKKTGADVVVRGEGEWVMVELAKWIELFEKNEDVSWINGISYMQNGTCIDNPCRKPSNVDLFPWPAYGLFPIGYYRLIDSPNASRTDFVMPVASARGCTFACNFCYRMVPGYRPRNPQDVCDEIGFLRSNYGITYIDFSDELLMASERRVHEICGAIEELQKHKSVGKFKWCCNGRLNYATKAVLSRMRDCGCVFINYGIESFDDESLERMGKHLTTEQITKGVESTLENGISPGLNIIFGNIGETKEVLWKGVDFLLKYADASQMRTIRPVTPYPGSKLFDYAVEQGLLGGVEDFYERKHTNSDLLTVNFTNMDDEEFYNQLTVANALLVKNHHEMVSRSMVTQMFDLYSNRDASFRGFRQS